MKAQDNGLSKVSYSVAITIAKSSDEVFAHLIDLHKWWLEDYVGGEIQLGTEFILKTGNGHFSKNKVLEFEQNKKLVWMATESLRKSDNYDWSGSKFIFELSPQGDHTQLQFTYDGVVLQNEYQMLVNVCDMAIKEKFYDFIVHGKVK